MARYVDRFRNPLWVRHVMVDAGSGHVLRDAAGHYSLAQVIEELVVRRGYTVIIEPEGGHRAFRVYGGQGEGRPFNQTLSILVTGSALLNIAHSALALVYAVCDDNLPCVVGPRPVAWNGDTLWQR